MFCVNNECNRYSKQMAFLTKMDDYQKKMCDTNKNMTQMGV